MQNNYFCLKLLDIKRRSRKDFIYLYFLKQVNKRDCFQTFKRCFNISSDEGAVRNEPKYSSEKSENVT